MKLIKFKEINLIFNKVKAHSGNQNNDKVDTLAKNTYQEEIFNFKKDIYTSSAQILWKDRIIGKCHKEWINDIFEARFMEEFLSLNRNNKYTVCKLEKIDWKVTYEMIKGFAKDNSLEDHFLCLFCAKIRGNELPTVENLIKRNPKLYKGI